jgi:hypothetical protein
MSAVYSYEAARRDDPMIERIKMVLELTASELRPEVAAIFSAFPYRRCCRQSHPADSHHQSAVLRLPSWLPGMRIKRMAPLVRKLESEILEMPFAYTEGGLVSVISPEVLCSQTLFRLQDPFLLAWSLTICSTSMTTTEVQPGRRKR